MEQTLVMDRRVVWNPLRLKEIDEAKSIIMTFKHKGHVILKADGTAMERFSPSLGEVLIKAAQISAKHVMKILNDKGDERLVWDKENGKQAKEAKAKFVELLSKNYKAYSVDLQGKKNKRITEFDVDAQEILMTPPTTKG